MTTKELTACPDGTRVCWIEAGETDPVLGRVDQGRSRVEWDDGQITLHTDSLCGNIHLAKRHCGSLRIRGGSIAGDCHGHPVWYCPHCRTDRCAAHAPAGCCDACGSKCERNTK